MPSSIHRSNELLNIAFNSRGFFAALSQPCCALNSALDMIGQIFTSFANGFWKEIFYFIAQSYIIPFRDWMQSVFVFCEKLQSCFSMLEPRYNKSLLKSSLCIHRNELQGNYVYVISIYILNFYPIYDTCNQAMWDYIYSRHLHRRTPFLLRFLQPHCTTFKVYLSFFGSKCCVCFFEFHGHSMSRSVWLAESISTLFHLW